MSQKRILIRGALTLTAAGVATRILGFFYRIFLSRSFGEEAVGLYQLIFPVYALGISLTCAGIQTALSRSVAGACAKGRPDLARRFLRISIGLSLLLSFAVLFFTQRYAEFLAVRLLSEPRCAPLLTAMSLAFPFASVHGCICGYYLGLKQTRVPALSQLAEQLARVGCVFLLFRISLSSGARPGILIAVAGLAAGEVAAVIFSVCPLLFSFHRGAQANCRQTAARGGALPKDSLAGSVLELLRLSVPLTANRILLNLLQSLEAVSIPIQLRRFGMNTADALSMYGVLTGMALPCVLFPSAVTNSIAAMMLPAIAELQASGRKEAMNRLIKKAVSGCFLLGCVCCLSLLAAGRLIGSLLFHSEMAGNFLLTLAWICPFLYANGCLISIINGLGETARSLLYNCMSLTIRILSIFLIIPFAGIGGYLKGLLAGQLTLFFLCIACLRRSRQ